MKPGGIPLTDDHLESRPEQAGFPRRALLLWAAALFLAAILFWRVHVPLFIIAPGLTMPAGEIVKVSAEGAVEQERGTFLVTTLAARQASLGTALAAIFDPRSHVVLRRQLVPPGQTVDEYLAENEELMRQSQVYAMAAALDYLGYSPRVTGAGAEVRRVLPGLRPAGALQVGDVIVAVDGRPVHLAEDLHDYVASVGEGRQVAVDFLRDGRRQGGRVETVDDPWTGAGQARLPVQVWTHRLEVELPPGMEIEIDAREISGPSAGLIFALEIANRFTPVDLTGGRILAGTGTIDARGRLGAVGGVPLKMMAAMAAGAEAFVMPEAVAAQMDGDRFSMEVLAAPDLATLADALARRWAGEPAAVPGGGAPGLLWGGFQIDY